jgi:hypothetical protein
MSTAVSVAHLTTAQVDELVTTGALHRRMCKRCPKHIFLLKDAEGKVQPLDASAPVWRITVDGNGDPVAVRTVAFTSHFSTCVAASTF